VNTLEADKRIEELEKKEKSRLTANIKIEGANVLREISAGSELKIETTCTGKRNVMVKLSKA